MSFFSTRPFEDRDLVPEFAYIDADEAGDIWPLCRLRYTGTHDRWGFAIHLASRDAYEDSYLPNDQPTGTPEDAIDCACGLYLADPPPGPDPSRVNAELH
jgi:hypothetical protein